MDARDRNYSLLFLSYLRLQETGLVLVLRGRGLAEVDLQVPILRPLDDDVSDVRRGDVGVHDLEGGLVDGHPRALLHPDGGVVEDDQRLPVALGVDLGAGRGGGGGRLD